MSYLNIGRVENLPTAEAAEFAELLDIYNYHITKNLEKDRYYEGHIPLSKVNLGIALPDALSRLEIGCEWGTKTVDVLAARSMFDGFVGSDGGNVDRLTEIAEKNNLLAEYKKVTRDQLKYGCDFATLSADPEIGCRIRFHSPQTAAAKWDGEKGRIGCGFAIIDTAADESNKTWTPALINYYTDSAIWELRKAGTGETWTAKKHPHKMGRPLMEPLVWSATSAKPFGQSRIKEPIRRLIEGYIRTIANATIGLEFATTPQKYILGVTDEQYDAIVNQKFKQYVGSILAGTTNPDTGEKPTFGQLQQGSLEPHVAMIRMLATQFSAATGLSVTDVGIINDANPMSSDAILAQTQTLVQLAADLNAGNAAALQTIAKMALAIDANKTLDELTAEEAAVIAHFKNPAMPSVSVTADAAIKIASVRPNFSNTEVFLEMIGFDRADIRRINAQEQRVRGVQILTEEFAEG